MNTKKWMAICLAAVLTLGSLYGCGAKNQTSGTRTYEEAYDEGYGIYQETAMADAAPMALNASQKTAGTSQQLPQNRKWVITMNLSAETEDLDAALETVQDNTLYTTKAFQNGVAARSILDTCLSDQAAADRALVKQGLLKQEELDGIRWNVTEEKADFGLLYNSRLKVLRLAFGRFTPDAGYEAFCTENGS